MRKEKPCEHLKRLRIPMTDGTRIQPNAKYLESVAYQLGLTDATRRPTRGVLTHRATMDATTLLTIDDSHVLAHSCVTCWIELMHSWKQAPLDRI